MRFFVALVFMMASLFLQASPVRAEPLKVNLARVSEPFMLSPHDMALSPDGKFLLIADMGQNRVVMLDPDTLTLQGIIGEGELSLPHDVVFDEKGRLLVADSGNDRIAIYEIDGNKATLVDNWGTFDAPEGIAAGPDGRFYVAITLENRVVCIRNGKIEASVDTAFGVAFDRPHDVEVRYEGSDHTVIATDPGNHRLLVFDSNLVPKSEMVAPDPPLSEPKYFSLDNQGRMFIADQYNDAVRVFDAAFSSIATFARRHIKLTEGVLVVGNRVWVSDSAGGRVLLYQLSKNR